MKVRVQPENINTREYFEKQYSNPSFWNTGWDGAFQRLRQTMSLINDPSPKHLDVGCADGTFTRYYLEKFPQTEGYGIDISQAGIDRAINMCPQGHFQQGDCYDLPYEDNFFDLVHSAEMLEHLEFPEKALSEMYRVLKPGGTLIVTTPNQKAAEYEEHLWKWDSDGVRLMLASNMSKDKLKGFRNIEEYPNFHNGHIMYLTAVK